MQQAKDFQESQNNTRNRDGSTYSVQSQPLVSDGKPQNQFQSSMNLFKGLVGIGVLSLPIAFKKSGWVAGIVFLVLCGIAMIYLSKQMMEIAQKLNSPAKNITEFTRETIGDKYSSFTTISLFSLQLGTCISYVIFFLDYIQRIFCFSLEADSYSCESRIPACLVCLVIILPCSFFRSMDSLQKWSLSANLIVIASLFVMSFYAILHIQDQGLPPVESLRIYSLTEALGIFFFAFEGVGIYFDVRHSMEQPEKFTFVLQTVLSILIVLYSCFGALGYLTFGANTADIILFNFDRNNDVIFVVQILYCVSLLLSYPLQIFPCVKLVDNKILAYMKTKLNHDGHGGYSHLEEVNHKYKDDQHQDNQGIQYVSGLSQEQQQQQKQQQFQQSIEQQQHENNKLDDLIIVESWEYTRNCYLVRLGFLIFVFGMSVCIDKMSIFVSLVGSLCGTSLGYVIPFMIIHHIDKDISLWKAFLNWMILCMTIVFGVLGAFTSLIDLIKDIAQNI